MEPGRGCAACSGALPGMTVELDRWLARRAHAGFNCSSWGRVRVGIWQRPPGPHGDRTGRTHAGSGADLERGMYIRNYGRQTG